MWRESTKSGESSDCCNCTVISSTGLHQGEWKFDPKITGRIRQAMVDELKEMGIRADGIYLADCR